MLLVTLGDSLLLNMLSDKGVMTVAEGGNRAGERTIRVGQDF